MSWSVAQVEQRLMTWFPGADFESTNKRLHSVAVLSERFRGFLKLYEGEIDRKIEDAKKDPEPVEKRFDVYAELTFAALVLHSCSWTLDYEPPIPGRAKGGPDFKVKSDSEFEFYVEAKHYRRVPEEKLLDAIKEEIATIESNCEVTLTISPRYDLRPDEWRDFVCALHELRPEWVAAIRRVVSRGCSAEQQYPLMARKEILNASFKVRPAGSPRNAGHTECEIEPSVLGAGVIGLGCDKLRSKYEECLKQLVPQEANVLYIDVQDGSVFLKDCVHTLNDMTHSNLSCVYVRGTWNGCDPVHKNPYARVPLPEGIINDLRTLKWPEN